MFGTALVFEHEPLTFSDLPGSAMHWTQVVGALSMAGIVLWLLLGYPLMRPADRARIPRWQANLFIGFTSFSAVFYVLFGLVFFLTVTGPLLRNVLLTAAGAGALLAACLPVFLNLIGFRLQRLWALARLSFLQALHGWVLYALAIPVVIFLFAGWFMPHGGAPVDQVRSYVGFVFLFITIFLLIIAVIQMSFMLPADIREQTIHTVVTKPVERFEIVLGRFLGFTALMTAVLVGMTFLSLLYVVRSIDPDAAAECLKAREPVYGELTFEGTTKEDRGENVGMEWEYRSYISGPMPGQPPQYAIWSFDHPSQFDERPAVHCEFAFAIYRTTKGEENAGVRCALAFTSWRYQKGDEVKYRAERNKELSKTTDRLSEADIENKLAEQFGYFEVPSMNLTNQRTFDVRVPSGLFKHAAKPDPALKAELSRRNLSLAPVRVRVQCNSSTQYLGMAKHDLYFRNDDPDGAHDRLWFAWNFCKGALGLWLRLCMVIGLATVFSTYLSGVISMLATALLYVFGLAISFVQEVGTGKNVGGGPLEAALRLGRRDHLAMPLEKTTLNTVAQKADEVYRFLLLGMMNIIPDVDTSDWVAYVAEGFNIAPGQLVVSCILMFGYLLPWFLLAYYLMKWRELASSN